MKHIPHRLQAQQSHTAKHRLAQLLTSVYIPTQPPNEQSPPNPKRRRYARAAKTVSITRNANANAQKKLVPSASSLSHRHQRHHRQPTQATPNDDAVYFADSTASTSRQFTAKRRCDRSQHSNRSRTSLLLLFALRKGVSQRITQIVPCRLRVRSS